MNQKDFGEIIKSEVIKSIEEIEKMVRKKKKGEEKKEEMEKILENLKERYKITFEGRIIMVRKENNWKLFEITTEEGGKERTIPKGFVDEMEPEELLELLKSKKIKEEESY